MKEVPMLFSTPMVQAILNGTKNQTRRMVKPQPDDDGLWNDTDFPRSLQSTLKGWNGTADITGESREWRQIQPGDKIWVKETFYTHPAYKKGESGELFDTDGNAIAFRGYVADLQEHYKIAEYAKKEYLSHFRVMPSLFMPKSAARIWLEVTVVKVERLLDISEQDAIDEGIELVRYEDDGRSPDALSRQNRPLYRLCGLKNILTLDPKKSYFSLWDKINGKDSHKENPWVWVVKFRNK